MMLLLVLGHISNLPVFVQYPAVTENVTLDHQGIISHFQHITLFHTHLMNKPYLDEAVQKIQIRFIFVAFDFR